jgi:transcriptional regulator with XRE-family HTH domain
MSPEFLGFVNARTSTLPVVASTIGENIARIRLRRGLKTQKALAEALGVPLPRVNDLERNRYALPDTDTLVRVAKALRCSIDDLLRGVDPEYDKAAGTRDLPPPATSPEEFSRDALELARWFDKLERPRQRAVLVTLMGETGREERTRGGRESSGRRKQAG